MTKIVSVKEHSRFIFNKISYVILPPDQRSSCQVVKTNKGCAGPLTTLLSLCRRSECLVYPVRYVIIVQAYNFQVTVVFEQKLDMLGVPFYARI